MKSKSRFRRQYLKQKIQKTMLVVEGLCLAHSWNINELMQVVETELDQILQSSALVETINSLIRPYLNMMKGQINQADLNLIMFFLNHRVYKRGKRKGYAPIELLTKQKLNKNAIDLLVDKILRLK